MCEGYIRLYIPCKCLLCIGWICFIVWSSGCVQEKRHLNEQANIPRPAPQELRNTPASPSISPTESQSFASTGSTNAHAVNSGGPLPESMVGSSEEGGDVNSRCYVCHLNFKSEKLVQIHASKGIGCADCHGASDAHIADESWSWGGKGTPPDRMYSRSTVQENCITCHPDHRLTVQSERTCTDCHGNHRLPVRKVRWD